MIKLCLEYGYSILPVYTFGEKPTPEDIDQYYNIYINEINQIYNDNIDYYKKEYNQEYQGNKLEIFE